MKFKIIIMFVNIACEISMVLIKATLSASRSSEVAFSPRALHHSLHISYFLSVIGPPTIQALHVLKAEHLKSKASQ